MSKRAVRLGLLCLSLVAFFLPWIAGQSAPFALNGYDLAEWASLHPAVRSMAPALLTPFLLRLSLAALLLLLLFHLWHHAMHRLVWVIAWLLAGAALLPPFEFFAGQGGDANYQQQFVLAIVVWISSGFLVWWSETRPGWQSPIIIGLTSISLLAAWFGYAQAQAHLSAFQLSISLGIGLVLLTLGQGLVILHAAFT